MNEKPVHYEGCFSTVGGYDCNCTATADRDALQFIHDNCEHDNEMLTSALNIRTGELAEANASVEALEAKVKSLSAHEICACSYDKPGDVCEHHSPQLAKAQERIAELKAALANLVAAAEEFGEVIDRVRKK